jgi:hypothetical protein
MLSTCRCLVHTHFTLTCVVPEVTSVCVGVEGQAGAQFQPHAREVLVMRQLPVA